MYSACLLSCVMTVLLICVIPFHLIQPGSTRAKWLSGNSSYIYDSVYYSKILLLYSGFPLLLSKRPFFLFLRCLENVGLSFINKTN